MHTLICIYLDYKSAGFDLLKQQLLRHYYKKKHYAFEDVFYNFQVLFCTFYNLITCVTRIIFNYHQMYRLLNFKTVTFTIFF